MKSLVALTICFGCLLLPTVLSLPRAKCESSSDCGLNGVCGRLKTCNCSKGFATTDVKKPCEYVQKSKLTAFLLSFIAGPVGADWFYLAAGNGGYIAAGVFKLLTVGGAGIWVFVDWIRILTDSFPDGNGVDLRPWD